MHKVLKQIFNNKWTKQQNDIYEGLEKIGEQAALLFKSVMDYYYSLLAL